MIALGSVVCGVYLLGMRLQAAEPPKIVEINDVQAIGRLIGTPVIVSQAAPACFSSVVRVTGFLTPRADAVVSPTLDGYQVAEIFVQEGDVVRDGQPLARMARIDGDGRADRSGKGGAGAPAASVLLRAPAAGIVVKSTARIGSITSPRGEPLFRLAVDQVIEADAEVSSIHLATIKEGQTVRVETEAGREIVGRVRRVSADIDPVTQIGHVRVAIDRNDALRAGRFVRAAIDARKSCGISVPRSAVLYRPEGPSVQVVRDRQVETLRVKVGLTSDQDAEIEDGLNNGDFVVANAGTSLRDGDRVSPVLADGAGRPAGRN